MMIFYVEYLNPNENTRKVISDELILEANVKTDKHINGDEILIGDRNTTANKNMAIARLVAKH
jgi:hypothetical protein